MQNIIRIKYLLVGIVISIIAVSLLYVEKKSKIEEYLKNQSIMVDKNYQIFFNHHKNLAALIFRNHINTSKIKHLFSKIYSANSEERQLIRQTIYEKLKPTYETLLNNNLQQLHFHLKNNQSFLRFHKPNMFGDDLSDIRATVKFVNENKKEIDGFEEGKINDGIRFVFPLSLDNQHLGSVEITFATLAMSKEFILKLDQMANFLIKKSVIDNKVLETELANYEDSPIEEFYVRKSTFKLLHQKYGIQKGEYLNSNFIKQYHKFIQISDIFSLYSSHTEKILTIKKIKNPVTQEFVALFVVRGDGTYIANKTKNFYFISALFITLIFAVCWFICKLNIYREKLQQNNNELKETIEQEIEQKNLFENIIENHSSVMLLIEPGSGNIIRANKAASIFYGYDQNSLESMNIANINKYKNIKEKRLNALDKKENYFIFKHHLANGDIKDVEVHSSPIQTNNKTLLFSIINDITDKVAAEKELNAYTLDLESKVKEEIEKNRIKDQKIFEQAKMVQMGELISMIAHQWRQPLGAIGSSIVSIQNKILLGKYDLNSKEGKESFLELLETKFKNMADYTEFLSKTIDNFRNFYKNNKEQEKLTLREIIENTLNIIQIPMENSNIRFDIQLENLDPINIYKNELMQVVLNILKNSEDNFKEKIMQDKIVCIKTYEENINQIMVIEDNGGGINDDILLKIFDPYFSTKSDKNGTGLGLYMSKIIVEEHHNGKLLANNTANGVRFTITLPKGDK
jgi:PAS domain S-box-containing protein